MLNMFLYSDSLTDPRDTEYLEHFTPLRLNGGGDISPMEFSNEKSEGNCISFGSDVIFEDTSSHIESVFDGVPGSDVNNSLLEEDIRDILFQAGYTKESIENVIASRPEMNVDKKFIFVPMQAVTSHITRKNHSIFSLVDPSLFILS